MTTARERARAAASDAEDIYADPDMPVNTDSFADAASDIWEPLLREAVNLLRDNAYSSEATGFLLRMSGELDPGLDSTYEHGVNYEGPHPSVECAYPPCRNRLRRSGWNHDGTGSQWCSWEHRELSE